MLILISILIFDLVLGSMHVVIVLLCMLIKKKDILILDKGLTDGLHDTKIAEAEYSIK